MRSSRDGGGGNDSAYAGGGVAGDAAREGGGKGVVDDGGDGLWPAPSRSNAGRDELAFLKQGMDVGMAGVSGHFGC